MSIAVAGSTPHAFFDVDETLIRVKSMFAFQDHWYDALADEAGRAAFTDEITRLRDAAAPRAEINRRYYRFFEGRAVAEVTARARDWFTALEAARPDLFIAPVVERLRAHQMAGHEVVFVSGSFPVLIEPVAARLGVRHILATRMEQRDGCYTGRILPPQCIAEGKAEALRLFLKEHKVPSTDCHAYGDDISDAPMLAAVGHLPGFATVDARVLQSNPASVRVLEKAGFVIIEHTTSVVERHRGKPVLVLRWTAP